MAEILCLFQANLDAKEIAFTILYPKSDFACRNNP
jgi:hypothetical protein